MCAGFAELDADHGKTIRHRRADSVTFGRRFPSVDATASWATARAASVRRYTAPRRAGPRRGRRGVRPGGCGRAAAGDRHHRASRRPAERRPGRDGRVRAGTPTRSRARCRARSTEHRHRPRFPTVSQLPTGSQVAGPRRRRRRGRPCGARSAGRLGCDTHARTADRCGGSRARRPRPVAAAPAVAAAVPPSPRRWGDRPTGDSARCSWSMPGDGGTLVMGGCW